MIDPTYHSQDYIRTLAHRAREKADWWANRIPEDVAAFVDFGCSDGSLFSALDALGRFPIESVGFGYDHNLTAIEQAAENCTAPGAYFSADLEDIITRAQSWRRQFNGPLVLILSSVMHEVLSTSTLGDFMDSVVFPLDPDIIVFRDMAPTRSAFYAPAPPPLRRQIEANPELAFRLRHFTARYGEISTVANLLHFLLKAPYERDWMAEMEENYFPISATSWVDALGPRYELRFFDHHQPAHIQERMESLCGGFIDQPTHLCMILERKLNGP
jgi:hypothetical protein